MSHHDIKLHNLLIVNSTQDILTTIEYLLFQIKYFQKDKFKGLFDSSFPATEGLMEKLDGALGQWIVLYAHYFIFHSFYLHTFYKSTDTTNQPS